MCQDLRAHEDHLVNLESLAFQGKKVYRVWQESVVLLASQVHRDCQDHRVWLDHLVLQVNRAQLVSLVCLEHLEYLENLVDLESLGKKARQDLPVHKADLVCLDHLDFQVSLVNAVFQDFRECQDLKARWDHLARTDPKGTREHMVYLDQKDRLA